MDNQFPDTIQTTTTTSTYHTTANSNSSGGRIAVDQAYLRSIPSVLRILEIVLSFLYWVILCAVSSHKLGFMIFVGLTAMITAIMYFVIFLLQLNKKVPFIAWELSELISNFVFACLFFIAAIITSVRAQYYSNTTEHGKLVFCTLLAWVLTLLFATSCFFSFRLFLAVRDRQSASRTTTATTTTVTAVPDYERSKEPEKHDVGVGEGGGVDQGTGTDLAY
ncbi:MARVEL domain-containing protein 1-like isoform X2 [Antedon mediterranea]|uniref:MARVEL domain-containing protein 1-like isoform X2 n=1 Tax=Antedon mediterranea TaxID=105859 RepID=UPI003AF7C590